MIASKIALPLMYTSEFNLFPMVFKGPDHPQSYICSLSKPQEP